MEQVKQEIMRLKEKQSIMGKIPIILLGIGILLTYTRFQSFGIMDNAYLITILAVIMGLIYLKPALGILCYFLFSAMYICAISSSLAFLYLICAVLLAFSITYGKNNLIFASIIVLLCASLNPFIIFIALGLYVGMCIQRGYGFPFMISFLLLMISLITSIFGTASIIDINTLANWNGSLSTMLSDGLQNIDTYLGIVTLVQDHFLQIVIIFAVFYIFFNVRKAGINEQENEAPFDEIFKKTLEAEIMLIVVYAVLYIADIALFKGEADYTNIILALFGVLVASIVSLLLPRYPLTEIATYKEQQAQQEREVLNQVVNTVDSSKIDAGWDSIAGYHDVKEELKSVLEPYLNANTMKEMRKNHIDPVKGLLLFGPPGSGKTLFAKAIAAEAKLPIIHVAGAEFTSKWVGESDRSLRNIFIQAREKAPCIIFFDELESFLPQRDKTEHSWEKTLVTTFLAQMDGFDNLHDILVIGATNYPDQIDPAAIRPGRFDKCIYIMEPDIEAKVAILKHYLNDKTQMSEEDFQKVAEKLERYTAADIEGLIKELYRQKHYQELNKEEIITASKQYNPTITLDMREQYEKLEKQYNRRFTKQEERVTKKKAYSWNDIAGMEEEKKKMKSLVEKPLLHADKYEEIGLEIPKGVLMYGPPGCGKTLFAKVIAQECNASFYAINGPQLLSGKIGESEGKLRRLFRMAREHKPSIIFFDEFDSIAEDRSKNTSSVKLINQLLTEMDGMEELTGVLVLAATNRIDDIDSALKRSGRFDSILYIGIPDEPSRIAQYQHYLNKEDHIDCKKLAQLSENFTCADISGCSKRIKEMKLDRLINEDETNITQEECEKIVSNYQRTLSDSEIEFYEGQRTMNR